MGAQAQDDWLQRWQPGTALPARGDNCNMHRKYKGMTFKDLTAFTSHLQLGPHSCDACSFTASIFTASAGLHPQRGCLCLLEPVRLGAADRGAMARCAVRRAVRQVIGLGKPLEVRTGSRTGRPSRRILNTARDSLSVSRHVPSSGVSVEKRVRAGVRGGAAGAWSGVPVTTLCRAGRAQPQTTWPACSESVV